MRDREAELLEEILRAPDDDAPRLVLADWLSERGDPRGELIQLQLRAASLEAGGERNKVRAAENKLLEAHRATWLGPIADRVEKAEFRRGFVAMVRMTARAWIAQAQAVLEVAPLIDELELVFGDDERGLGADVFARPELRRVRSLSLRCAHPEPVRALGEAPHLGGLRTLIVEGGRLGRLEGEALAFAAMPELRALRLTVSPDLALTPEVLAAIGNARFTLETLFVDGQEWSMAPTALGAEGAAAIASGKAFASLKRLELPFTGLGVSGVARMLSLKSLEAIDVTKARIGPAGLDPIFAHEGLREVNLYGNELGDEGTTRIASSPALARWTFLHLGGNDIGLDGVQALADSPYAKTLRTLNLVSNGRLRDRAIDVLLASENLAEARIWVRNGFLARKKTPITVERKQAKKRAK